MWMNEDELKSLLTTDRNQIISAYARPKAASRQHGSEAK